MPHATPCVCLLLNTYLCQLLFHEVFLLVTDISTESLIDWNRVMEDCLDGLSHNESRTFSFRCQRRVEEMAFHNIWWCVADTWWWIAVYVVVDSSVCGGG